MRSFGEPGETRTLDPSIKSALLCHLSYRLTVFEGQMIAGIQSLWKARGADCAQKEKARTVSYRPRLFIAIAGCDQSDAPPGFITKTLPFLPM